MSFGGKAREDGAAGESRCGGWSGARGGEGEECGAWPHRSGSPPSPGFVSFGAPPPSPYLNSSRETTMTGRGSKATAQAKGSAYISWKTICTDALERAPCVCPLLALAALHDRLAAALLLVLLRLLLAQTRWRRALLTGAVWSCPFLVRSMPQSWTGSAACEDRRRLSDLVVDVPRDGAVGKLLAAWRAHNPR